LIVTDHHLVGPLISADILSGRRRHARNLQPELESFGRKHIAVPKLFEPNQPVVSRLGIPFGVATHLSTHFPLTKLMTQGKTLTSNLATRKSESATEARTNNV
jgi:hypothetical protein